MLRCKGWCASRLFLVWTHLMTHSLLPYPTTVFVVDWKNKDLKIRPGLCGLNFKQKFFNCGKIYITKFTILTIFKCIQFSSVKYIHIVVKQTFRTFSSYRSETTFPLNKNSFVPLPSPWQPPFSFLFIGIWLLYIPRRRKSYVICLFVIHLFHLI